MIRRFTSLKNDKKTYEGILSDDDVEKINELLKYKDNIITYTLNIIVIYATYFLKEPVHTAGTAFPGHVSIYCDGNNYFCPVKKNHINNEKSVCKYCIAKIPKEWTTMSKTKDLFEEKINRKKTIHEKLLKKEMDNLNERLRSDRYNIDNMILKSGIGYAYHDLIDSKDKINTK